MTAREAFTDYRDNFNCLAKESQLVPLIERAIQSATADKDKLIEELREQVTLKNAVIITAKEKVAMVDRLQSQLGEGQKNYDMQVKANKVLYELLTQERDEARAEVEVLSGFMAEVCQVLECAEPNDDWSPVHEIKRLQAALTTAEKARDELGKMVGELGAALFEHDYHDLETELINDQCSERAKRTRAAVERYTAMIGNSALASSKPTP